MHTPSKSRCLGFHIAQHGVPFITLAPRSFTCHTSGGVRRIHPFASQDLPPSPQPKAKKGLTSAQVTHPTFGFCVTTPPAPARRPAGASSDAFLGSPTGPGTVTRDSPTHPLHPNTVSPLPAGRSLTFTTLATDAAGNPVPNAPVALFVSGEDILQLNGIPGADGKVTFTYAGTTTNTNDALGHLTNVAAPLGRNTTYVYDNNGNKTSETDANNHTTTYEYDELNRLSKVTYPDTKTTLYTYDWRNHAIDTTDQANRTTHNVYDAAGRLTSVTTAYGTPDAATTTCTYYNDGRKARTGPGGSAISETKEGYGH